MAGAGVVEPDYEPTEFNLEGDATAATGTGLLERSRLDAFTHARLWRNPCGFAARFISWAGTTVWNLLEIIFDVVKPGAMGYVKRTGAALKGILKNPIPFVGNLAKAAKLGFPAVALTDRNGRFMINFPDGGGRYLLRTSFLGKADAVEVIVEDVVVVEEGHGARPDVGLRPVGVECVPGARVRQIAASIRYPIAPWPSHRW